jgi:hypothetical protein
VQAAQDALLQRPADEILIFALADDDKDWYEGDLWKHTDDSLEPPLKLVVVDGGPEGNERVVKTDTSSAGYSNNDAPHEVGSAYLPGLNRGDFIGMVVGIVGTIGERPLPRRLRQVLPHAGRGRHADRDRGQRGDRDLRLRTLGGPITERT